MSRSHDRLALTAAALLVGVLSVRSVPAAEPMTALVTSLTGNTQPYLAPMSEVPANTTIQVGQGSRLTLMHYRNCTTETITGGRVTVLATGFDDHSATVESRSATACPSVEQLSLTDRGTATAATVMRGEAPPGIPGFSAPSLTLPARGTIYFVGPQSANIDSITVVDALGRTAAVVPGSARLLRVDLVPGQTYRLRLAIRGWPQPAERLIAVTSATNAASAIVRVE